MCNVVVYPFLSLISNQLDQMRNFGLKVAELILGETNLKELAKSIKNNEIDLVLCTPETLSNEICQKVFDFDKDVGKIN